MDDTLLHCNEHEQTKQFQHDRLQYIPYTVMLENIYKTCVPSFHEVDPVLENGLGERFIWPGVRRREWVESIREGRSEHEHHLVSVYTAGPPGIGVYNST